MVQQNVQLKMTRACQGRWSARGPGVQPGPSGPCTLSRWRRELVVAVGRQGGGEGGGEGRCTGQAVGRYPPSLGHRLGFNGGALELGLGPLPVP